MPSGPPTAAVPLRPRRSLLDPLTIHGRAGRSVTFPVGVLLAPMDGVTDPVFRGLVLDLGDAGGAVTEFLRITTGPMGEAPLRRELGPRRTGAAAAGGAATGAAAAGGGAPRIPVGLQLMAPGPEHVAGTASHAERAGADWVDLNFGCPVKRVFNKCAGSALLAEPRKVEDLVAAAVAGTALPVSAKVRAGIGDAAHLEEILDAAARGGAAMVTLHARLRTDSYAAAARWEWIARAAAYLRERHPGVVLVGNGSVHAADDAHRMFRETGCDAVMVARGAVANPFVFREIRGGPPPSPSEAAAFALRYVDALLAPGALRGGAGKVKQVVRFWQAGGLFEGREEERAALLRSPGAAAVRGFFEEFLEPGRSKPGSPGTGTPKPGFPRTGPRGTPFALSP